MKPLSELLKEFRGQAVREGHRGQEYHDGQAGGFRCCADELQAWLREADAWTKKWKMVGKFDYESRLVFKGFRKVVRTELLGTTRTEGKK